MLGPALTGWDGLTGHDPLAGTDLTGGQRAWAIGATLLAAAGLGEGGAGGGGGDDGLVTVSRWGRPGLEPGDWVMQGPANGWNYFWSFKFQRGWGNIFAPFDAGQEFQVPASTVRWPSGWGWDGWWKGLYGQRQYWP